MNFSRVEARKAVESMAKDLEAIQRLYPSQLGLVQMQALCFLVIMLDTILKDVEERLAIYLPRGNE